MIHITPLYSIGEPNNVGGVEDCVMMYTENGYWNDESCGNTMQLICEKNGK